MSWLPSSGAVKREILLGIIAGIASFAAAHYLRKKFESQNVPAQTGEAVKVG